jgi:hypothetical protein
MARASCIRRNDGVVRIVLDKHEGVRSLKQ